MLKPILCLYAACSGVAFAGASAAKWSVYEVNLTSGGASSNWYTDPAGAVIATFRGPGGVTRKVPGFWDGDRSFKIRFTPVAEGAWEYQTSSPNPD